MSTRSRMAAQRAANGEGALFRAAREPQRHMQKRCPRCIRLGAAADKFMFRRSWGGADDDSEMAVWAGGEILACHVLRSRCA